MEPAPTLSARPAAIVRQWTHDWGGIGALALGLYTIAFLIWLGIGGGDAAYRTTVSDLAFIPSGGMAVVLAWRVSTHGPLGQRTRRAWRILALGFLTFWAGDIVWAFFEVGRGQAPFPSAADLGYLLFYPLVIAGLLAFPVAPQTRVEKTKFWLDTLTILLGGWMVVWFFVLGPTAVAKDTPLLLTVLSAAYPVGDLVLIFGIAVLLLRSQAEVSRVTLACLAAGVAAFLVADVSFGYLSLQGTYHGGDWPDGFWMVAQLLFATGAQFQYWHATQDARPDREPGGDHHRISPVPYAAVALGYVLLIASVQTAPVYPLGGLLLGAIAVTAVVLIRQLTLLNENVRLLADMQVLARTDGLTGLFSRRHFFELAQREFARARRFGRPIGAVMFDVDHFKLVNDRNGHATGDEVLRAIAGRVSSGLREIDLVGRYGGDEFAALLPETSEEAAAAAAERLVREISATAPVAGGTRIAVTVSAGVADGDGCADFDALLRRADDALYQAKATGRNRVVRFTLRSS